MKLLIIEVDSGKIDIFKDTLYMYELVFAEDINEVKITIQKNKFDAIFMSYIFTIPGTNTYQLVNELYDDKSMNRNTPVIIHDTNPVWAELFYKKIKNSFKIPFNEIPSQKMVEIIASLESYL